jgi:hypothetical protein
MRYAYKILVRKYDREETINKLRERVDLSSMCSAEQGPVTVCGEHRNVHSGSIKGTEFLDWLSSYYLLKDSAAQAFMLLFL